MTADEREQAAADIRKLAESQQGKSMRLWRILNSVAAAVADNKEEGLEAAINLMAIREQQP